MVIGIVAVLVVGGIIFNAITSGPKNADINGNGKTNGGEESTESAVPAGLPKKYTVGEGEDLWSISEKFYNSGYNWVDIVEENKLVDPDKVEAGTQLTIPAVSPRPTPTGVQAEIYTVKRGETLFDIAVGVYGDGYAWARIAQANNLRNANRIEPGQKLIIPR